MDSLTITEIYPHYKNIELSDNPFKIKITDLSTIEEIFYLYLSLVVKNSMHSKCSKDYCLKEKRGQLQCRFGYPKNLETMTRFKFIKDKISVDLK